MIIALLFSVIAVAASSDLVLSKHDLSHWEMFKIAHEKDYSTESEEKKRQSIFLDNLNFVRKHNAKFERGIVNFTVAINKFSDMTGKEYAEMLGGVIVPTNATSSSHHELFTVEDKNLPKAINWRKRGAVTPVKDQGSCGSCWAFSATGSLEGQHYIKTKKLISLSEQNLVDCSHYEGNQGCRGGLMDQAFAYIKKNKGIDTEAAYPYKGKEGTCRYKPKGKGTTVTSYVKIPQGNEKALTAAIAKAGPVSIAIDASMATFQMYDSGIYSDPVCSSKQLNHGMLAVGYGHTKSNGDYYLLKNSWGTTWGMKGYVMMARNEKNMCGVAAMAGYPKI